MHFHVAWYITDLMACKTHSGNKLLNLYDIQIQSVSESQFIDFEGAPKQKQRLDKWQSQKKLHIKQQTFILLNNPNPGFARCNILTISAFSQKQKQMLQALKGERKYSPQALLTQNSKYIMYYTTQNASFYINNSWFFFLLKPLGDWSEYRVICQWLRYPILDMLIWQV